LVFDACISETRFAGKANAIAVGVRVEEGANIELDSIKPHVLSELSSAKDSNPIYFCIKKSCGT
jgi:hypothetical protein